MTHLIIHYFAPLFDNKDNGDPIYVNVGYAWRSQFNHHPPLVPTENNHVGSYRREIVVPASWNGKDIIAHFGSVTSNMYLWVFGCLGLDSPPGLL